ncbi:unnamed protein product [marine sediment metagenome]|uniref:Uncharacterized protein n=1 Tax=marine sediment metagenome TaxID=412755 RepID=X1S0M5_9ZZZZ
MAKITEEYIETLNPGSARFGDPGELVVQRMRFQLKADASYNVGETGFGVHLNEMSVVEAASVTREGALGDVSANYQPVIKEIQADASGNKAIIQLYYPRPIRMRIYPLPSLISL